MNYRAVIRWGRAVKGAVRAVDGLTRGGEGPRAPETAAGTTGVSPAAALCGNPACKNPACDTGITAFAGLPIVTAVTPFIIHGRRTT